MVPLYWITLKKPNAKASGFFGVIKDLDVFGDFDFCNEARQGGFEVHAVPRLFRVFQGDGDGFGGVVRSDGHGVVPGQAVHDAADAGAGEEVAGAVIGRVDPDVLVGEEFPGAGVEAHEAGHAVFEGNPGEDGDGRAELAEFFEEGLDFAFRHIFFIRGVRHEAGFGDVRDDDVGVAAEFSVAFCVVEIEGWVEGAVVGHDRVDEFECLVVRGEVGEDFFDHLDLFEGAEVAGVDAVKLDVFVFPVLGDRGDLIA